ncbi:MAG TPA: membrane dipeptidase [Vicinamibacteria bacterium]
MRKLAAALFLLAALAAFFFIDLEPSFEAPPLGVEISDRARKIHEEAIVIDLHVDSLLWPRDLSRRGEGGHFDFPRMREGGLDAVAFTLPTRFFGVAGLKALHDRWPVGAWFSPRARLEQQLEKTGSWTELSLARSASEIRRNHAEGKLSYFHGIEGAHALDGDLRRVEELKERGVLFLGLVHLARNEIGGSSAGADAGLTELGGELVLEMNRRGVLVDLAHASETTFREASELTAFPPIVSHTGVRAVHDTWRNLSDDEIRAVADRCGVVGVMLSPPALREPSLEEAVRHLEHLIAVGGEDTAAIGSDFDGYTEPPIDASGLPALTELLLRRGHSEERIRKILGENVLRVLDSLERPRPERGASGASPGARSRGWGPGAMIEGRGCPGL